MISIKLFLSPEMVSEITRIGLDAYPSEACGVLLPTPLNEAWGEIGKVVQLPNRSLQHHDHYALDPDDVAVAIGDWAHSVTFEQRDSVAVWHTHPQGNIGPSKTDLDKKHPDIAYLVVALDMEHGTGTPCWF